MERAERRITEREQQVLELVVAGRSNKEIAAELGIEERTARAHVGTLMRKFGVKGRVLLSVHAVRQSMVSNE